jgi:diguanylate cyclase (GGDEF)-like protein/PAS domain S-box-containing protein
MYGMEYLQVTMRTVTNSQPKSKPLNSEHERLWLALQASQLGLWDWNMSTGAVEVDQRWLEMLGYGQQDLNPFSIAKFMELCHPDDQKIVDLAIKNHIEQQTGFYQVEIRLAHKSGIWVWIKSTGMIVERSSTGTPLRMTGIHENVTDLVNQRIQGEIARSQLEAAQRLGGLGSWYLDIATDKVTWSDELFRMQGLEPNTEPPAASTHHQLFSPESWEQLKAALAETIEAGIPYELELEMYNNGIFHGWMLARGEAIRNPGGEIVGVLGVALDITRSKSQESELRQRALLDPLTKLGNRANFDLSLSQAIKLTKHNQNKFALMLIDIDYFKLINDEFGHDVGDQALVKLAERLIQTLRSEDKIFRLGGDEFIVILPNSVSAQKAAEIAERVCQAFRQPLIDLDQPLNATVSIGLVLWNGSETPAELIKRADEALYKAKSAGKNQYYAPEL